MGATEAPQPRRNSAVPRDLAVGPDGSVYLADTEGNRIHKIDPNGSTITAVVGNGRYWGHTIPDGTPALRTGIRATCRGWRSTPPTGCTLWAVTASSTASIGQER